MPVMLNTSYFVVLIWITEPVAKETPTELVNMHEHLLRQHHSASPQDSGPDRDMFKTITNIYTHSDEWKFERIWLSLIISTIYIIGLISLLQQCVSKRKSGKKNIYLFRDVEEMVVRLFNIQAQKNGIKYLIQWVKAVILMCYTGLGFLIIRTTATKISTRHFIKPL